MILNTPVPNFSDGFVFRVASLADADVLFAWRNDLATRLNSIDATLISSEHHVAWLKSALQSDTRELLIFEKNGIPIGTVRFDKVAAGWELSWTIAPEFRGAGYGRKMVSLAVTQKPNDEILARIKPSNLASKRIVTGLGFRLLTQRDDIEIWCLKR